MREVDIDPLQLPAIMLAEEAADLFQHLLAETDDLSVFLRKADKIVRENQIALITPQPRKRLGSLRKKYRKISRIRMLGKVKSK